MKNIFSLCAIILLSAIAVSAQAQMKAEHATQGRSQAEGKAASARIVDVRKYHPRVLKLGPTTTYLNNGLSIDEVLSVLGKPTSVVERQDGELRLAIYIFPRSEGHVLVANFENGLLVGSRTEIAEALVQNEQTGQ